jgi:branched-chain amino acid aminotransferase
VTATTHSESASRPAATAAPAPRQVWIDGKLAPAHEAVVNVYDHGLLYGDGVFEGIRTYGGKVFKLATHLRRLFDSARSIRLDIPYTPEQLAAAVRDTVAANDQKDGYIRLCVTRGVGSLGLNPFTCKRPTLFIIADAISLYPREVYEHGMAVVTAATMRTHPASLSPRIKSMNYLNNILAKIEAIDAGVLEAVMLNPQGYVAECTGDNIFIVRNDLPGFPGASLLTPPLHAGILEGVTRNVVMQIAVKQGIHVREADLTKHDLYTADELFLTGTAAEVVPVTKADGRKIGGGAVGPITRQLQQAFHHFATRNTPED